MKQQLSNFVCISVFAILSLGCGKSGNSPIKPPKTCSLIGIEQQNTGGKPDYALTLAFNGVNPIRLTLFDSLNNNKLLEEDFILGSTDSIRIDQYQYIKLDADQRVIAFVTRADMSQPATSDEYRYEYSYNTNGYLIGKKLFANGSTLPLNGSNYTYNNNLLVKCEVWVGNPNIKVLEADLTYHSNITAKDWLYTIPDAFESYLHSTLFSFGNKPRLALSQVTTKLLHPGSGATMEIWNTTYTNYSLNADGYIQSVTANGDLQKGMATMHGKTVFKYQCQ